MNENQQKYIAFVGQFMDTQQSYVDPQFQAFSPMISRLFRYGENYIGRYKKDAPEFEISITFEDTRLTITVVEFDGPAGARHELERVFEEGLKADSARILAASNTYRRRIENLRKWCEQRSRESQTRSKSLDEIFSF